MATDRTFVTVVTGLPRSGTSMMMRMLEAGGLDILTDGIRKSNEDNPRGYYNELLTGPEGPLHEVNAFLGGGLHTPCMIDVVEPSLYRNRQSSIK